MPSLLVVLSGATRWTQQDGSQRPTGFWAEEFVEPHKAFTAAGIELTVVTPGGRPAVVDEGSLSPQSNNGDEEKVAELRAYLENVKDLLASPGRLEDVDPAGFDGVFIPGGHGPMQDLAVNEDVARVLQALLPDRSKVVAGLCHGPAAFLPAGDEEGKWLFKGRRLTAFTDEEETQTGLAPTPLADRQPPPGRRGRLRTGSGVGLARDRRRQPRHRPEPGLRGRRRTRGPQGTRRAGLSHGRSAAPDRRDRPGRPAGSAPTGTGGSA